MAPQEEHDALYYPYVHFRDDAWVKSTLLAFGRVRRMVPENFETNDSPFVRQCESLPGKGNLPLVVRETTESTPVWEKQREMLERLKPDVAGLQERYSREATYRQYGAVTYENFQLHRGKMGELLHFFEEHGLTWHPQRFNANGFETGRHEDWFALHPMLGKAVMSVIAHTIAGRKGLGIVTDQTALHHAIVADEIDSVFDELLGVGRPVVPPARVAATDDLTEFVLRYRVNVNALSAEDIQGLLQQGEALRQFKDYVATFAARLPPIEDYDERRRRLTELANELISKWEKFRATIPKAALDAVVDAGTVKVPDVVQALLAGATAGMVSLGAGLAIGFVTYSGFKVWRSFRKRQEHPTRFLSQIVASGGRVCAPVEHESTQSKSS